MIYVPVSGKSNFERVTYCVFDRAFRIGSTVLCSASGISALSDHSGGQLVMAAYVQDSIMLLGDSLTQNSWEPYGLGQRLASQEIFCLIVGGKLY